MKYTRATLQRSRDATDIYYKRLLDMMNDYEISLRTAILWDFEGFMPYVSKGMMLSEEDEIDFYLHCNYIPQDSRIFFTGVALGYFPDYGFDNEEETEQKDAGSSSTA